MEKVLQTADAALRTLFAEHRSARPMPTGGTGAGTELTPSEKKLSAAYMRVNHVGEICAQALYTAQAAVTPNRNLRLQLESAAREETDHLAWTRQRLDALGSRPSLLNPLWYAGAFALGLVAGKISDRVSLGFVAETEDQVSEHLGSHLRKLPVGDTASRAVVAQMKMDEEEHAVEARRAGGVELPTPVRALMRGAAKVMTTTAHYI
jgi:ubiquinone biosynthesis monooxygenase Coq7